jgi:hypothetical protein
MIHNADDFKNSPTCCIDGKWVIARPIDYTVESLKERIKESWGVLTGKYEAVRFYKQ